MTNSDDQAHLEGRILQQLYEPFFMSFDGANIRDWPEEQDFDKVQINNVLDRMSNAGFINRDTWTCIVIRSRYAICRQFVNHRSILPFGDCA